MQRELRRNRKVQKSQETPASQGLSLTGTSTPPPRMWFHLTGWAISSDNEVMPNATITVDAALKERLADLASQSDSGSTSSPKRYSGESQTLMSVSSAAFQCLLDALALRPSRSKTSTASPTAPAKNLVRGRPIGCERTGGVACSRAPTSQLGDGMVLDRSSCQGWPPCALTALGVIRVCAHLPGGPWPPDTTADGLLLLTAAGTECGVLA
jgi:hypothetical protein